MKLNQHISLNIKGRDWYFILLSDKVFDKRFPPEQDGDETCAVAEPKESAVYLKKSLLTIPTIRHEIFHILVFSSLIESSSLDRLQMEELGAEIMGEHALEVCIWAEKVMNFYTVRNSK